MTVAELKFTGNATLTLSDATNALTAKKVVVDAGKNATISLGTNERLEITDTTNTIIDLGDGASLTLEGAKIKGAGKLQLLGKGKLILKQALTDVANLEITEGGTLELAGDGDLPVVPGAGNIVTIPNGNIIVDKADPFAAALRQLTLIKGDLTLNKKLRNELVNVTVNNGTLTVEAGTGIQIGDASVPNGVVVLGDAAGTSLFDMKGDMTLKELKASHTTSTIKIASGKTLSVVKPDVLPAMAAAVEGNLLFDLSASATVDKVTLNGNVDGKVTFKGAAAQQKSLELGSNVTVKELVLDGGSADKAKLTLKGNNTITTLSFKDLDAANPEVDLQGDATVGSLKPVAAGASLKVAGAAGKKLTVEDGAASGNWDFTVEKVALALKKGTWLSHNTTATLDSADLSLPSGNYANLSLAVSNGGALSVSDVTSVASPLLTVKKVNVAAGKTLTFKRPTSWGGPLSPGQTVTLLEIAGTLTLMNAASKIVGDPADDSTGKIEEINTTNNLKKLIFTAKTNLVSPDLTAPNVLTVVPGSTYNGMVLASGDVDPTTWTVDVVSADPAGVIASSDLELVSKDAKSVIVRLKAKSTFKSATLKVRAKSAMNTLYGEVTFTLTAGSPSSPGLTPKPGLDNMGWTSEVVSEDKMGNMVLKLRTRLFYESLPKAVEADVSGMPVPKCELLDETGRRVLAVGSAALKNYTLVLTCNVTKAQVAAGAAVRSVRVTKADGTVETFPVNKTVNEIPRKPGSSEPLLPDPDGKGKGGGGGGCDAGFSGLALALAGVFLLRRKAS